MGPGIRQLDFSLEADATGPGWECEFVAFEHAESRHQHKEP